jgi:hypothetical protein
MVTKLAREWDKEFLTNINNADKKLARCCIVQYTINMDIIKIAIKSELKRRGWSNYRLAKELKGKMPERTLYSYLSDEQKSKRDISAQRASIILKELGLKVTR